MGFNQKDYDKEHYQRISIALPKRMYEQIKTVNGLTGETVSGFIKRAISSTLENEYPNLDNINININMNSHSDDN